MMIYISFFHLNINLTNKLQPNIFTTSCEAQCKRDEVFYLPFARGCQKDITHSNNPFPIISFYFDKKK